MKEVKVKDVIIGGEYIPIQTMIKNPVTDIDLTVSKINRLQKLGCDIIRISVPDQASAVALKEVIRQTSIPIVADIHFDYRLAIQAIEAGVHKVRINPGNIGSADRVKKVIACLKEYQIPVRIGINGGSLPDHLMNKGLSTVEMMLKAAEEEINYFEEADYHNIVLSFKSSHVLETIEVNRKADQKFHYPLHIGITEAGDLLDGTIKNCCGLTPLLLSGIGNTIRVSLTAPEEEEIKVGQRILEAVGKRVPEIEVVSCPTCGRTEVNISDIVQQIKMKIQGKKFNKQLKIAVMGCVVNGPGEAKDCDFGIACGKNKSMLFYQGKKLKMIKNEAILDELLIIMEKFYEKD
ncbi:MAG: flavodoxin-dependent (E)-4-hydroxy-3-methylbut-2-enyl-diphosphate synthase [Spirochaetes bacterium]|nr:flavodoxin-dependent (E)-4-hydroxy-3-methylbut-2-enyl-diphosphate synthase [Spirochaetota bacterium]